MKANHNRFKDAPWYPKQPIHVLIGGAGGIGSWTALAIARAGFIPTVYDFDLIEEHNIGGQLFGRPHITMPKVVALQQIVKTFADVEIDVFNEKVTSDTLTNNYVITAFDNIQARKDMFLTWQKAFLGNGDAIFIDGRLDAERMQIFCIQGNDLQAAKAYYEDHIFPDADVEDAPCTMKQTSHAAMMIAAHITGFFTNFITNRNDESSYRGIPFNWEYFIPIDMLTVTNAE